MIEKEVGPLQIFVAQPEQPLNEEGEIIIKHLSMDEQVYHIKKNASTIGMRFLMDQIKDAQLNSDFLDDLLKVLVVVNMQKSDKQDHSPQKQPETTELEENSVLH